MNERIAAALGGLLLCAAAAAQDALPVIEMTSGFHRIEAEVAATDRDRQLGLMNRKAMPAQRGMLFLRINGEWQDHLLFAIVAGDPIPTPKFRN